MELSKEEHLQEAIDLFEKNQVITSIAKQLCLKYNVIYTDNERRKISSWLTLKKQMETKKTRILIYDIETSQAVFKRFWTGKGYLGTRDMIREPQILTIAYKWLGEDEIYVLKWKNKSDKKLVKKFLKVYNNADIIIGVNNNNFDNRWINARAAKYGFEINLFIKSFDIQKQAKRMFRMPGYSMEYMCNFFNIPVGKYKHSGISMWNAIEDGTKAEAKIAMDEMIHYNKEDVLRTEDLYYRLRPYFNHVAHIGVLEGKSKITCPECGGTNTKLIKTTITSAGTIQRVMKCLDDNVKFKISNSAYLKMIDETSSN
jgi:DNA polymerase elongation subunit (family B)